MADRPDALTLLRLANPVAETDLPSPDSPQARRLLTEILAAPPDAPVTQPRRNRWRIALATAVVAALTIAGAWLWLRPVTDPLGVSCYASVDLQGDRAPRATGSMLDPVDACGDYWRNGVLVNPDIVPPGSVPPLTACVTDQGGLAVFPTDDPDTCARLGLAEPDPGSIEDGNAVRALTDQLIALLGGECVPIDLAEQQVRQILDETGFGDWSIVAGPATEERPCATLAVDAPTRTINLVPMPPQPSG